jgi:hypothetical protein
LKLPSLKITTLALVCLIVLATVIYINVIPHNNSNQVQSLNLSVENSTTTGSPLAQLKSKISQNQASTSDSQTVTSQISQNFAQNYLNLKSAGQLSTSSVSDLIQNIATTPHATSSIALSLRDISTFSDRDVEKVHNFGNATAKAVLKYYSILKISPLELLNQAQTSGNTSTFQAEITPIANAYRSLALDLVKIPAPANLAADYLDTMNGYLALSDDVANMSASFRDPVRGFAGLNNYQADLPNQAYLLKNIADYFKTNAILFSNTEAGGIWSSLIQ